MRTCAVCGKDVPEGGERCPNCDVPAPRTRQIVTDESSLPEDVRREIDDARRQLLIPQPVQRGPKVLLQDAGRAFAIACAGVLLAMIAAWIAFRVL